MITNKLFDEIKIGDTATLSRVITKQDVHLFGALTGDMNPTHFSDDYARDLLNRQTVSVHAMWPGSLISSLLGNDLPGPGTVYKSQELQFHKAVELGDTVIVTITANQKNEEDKSVEFHCSVVNEQGERIITGAAHVYAPVKKVSGEGVLPTELEFHPKKIFKNLVDRCSPLPPVTVAVCHPCDKYSLLGAIEATKKNLIVPILVGPEARIKKAAGDAGVDISGYQLVNTKHSDDSALKAVELCRQGGADALMKGSLHTDELISKVIKKDTGLRTDKRLSHVFVMDVPTYPRPLFITDAAINIDPGLAEKADIITNSIELANSLGISEPKVAILSAVETINPKIPSTIDAAALCKMAHRKQIQGAILDGPLAFDNAISKDSATTKGISSQVAGQADILLVPDLESGNMLSKQLKYLASADLAGIVLGARVPIILTSRADSDKARLASCAVAVALVQWRQTQAVKVI